MKKSITFFILLLILSSLVLSLGVTPARNTLNYKQGETKKASFKIINDGSQDLELVIDITGELKNAIQLNERRVHLSSSDSEKIIEYNIIMLDNLKPGNHRGEIFIKEDTKKKEGDNTIVGAVLALITQVDLFVPYPGKYAEAELNVKNANKGEPVEFIIPIINLGEFDLENVYANIDIYNDIGEKVESFNTKTISIKSKNKIDLIHKWDQDLRIGKYKAVVTLIYDGESINLEKIFQIGSVSLELQQIKVNNFELGQIVKMDLLVENKWSEEFSDVFTQTQIFDNSKNILADFNSPTDKIPALSKKVLSSYWDTAGVKEGTYDTKVIIHYRGSKSVETNLKLVVKKNSLEVIGLGYVLSEEGDNNTNNDTLIMILIIIIGVLILLNLVWFFVLRKYLKKPTKK